MSVIFKREFFSAFRRLYGYVTLGAMLLVSAILFSFYNLQYTTESISTVCSGMSVFVSLVIPVLAVNAFPSRKKCNTDDVYSMMPVSVRDVIFGKYLAALAIVMIPSALLACCSVFAGFFGEIDHFSSYNALLGLMLLETAWLAVCTFIAKRALYGA